MDKLTFRLISLTAIAMAAIAPASGMNNADIIKMTQAQVSEETVLLAIGSAPAEYDTGVEALIEMKKAGVSDAVVQKMIAAASRGAASSAPATTAAATPESSFANVEMPSIAPPLANPTAGRGYFLRSTIHVEEGEHNATNYSRGAVVPINTPVRIETMKGDKIVIQRGDTGERLTVKNVSKYTRKSTPELAGLLFAEQETPLHELPAELAASIRNGDMRLGMTKEQVLMARGYPPAHETSSTESDRWVYWTSRYVKQTVLFSNGRLVEGRGIR